MRFAPKTVRPTRKSYNTIKIAGRIFVTSTSDGSPPYSLDAFSVIPITVSSGIFIYTQPVQSEILYYISQQHLAGVTVLHPGNVLYPAVMHVAHRDNPFKLIFLTDKHSKKIKELSKLFSMPAGVVLGFSEKECTTLQMNGVISEVTPENIDEDRLLYTRKFPFKKKLVKDPTKIFVEFVPTWWKYTNFSTHPCTILHSEM